MSKVDDEFENVDRNHLLNAVYALYEDRAEGEHALNEFESDLEATAAAYEHAENTR
ncbi:hypothetical protein [Natrinema salinisoli]|uniref:hypothetical protein n=1 Tax=Natrinema salinisoli TaxID=2878535 RepID=UPI001CF03203|nr:hypothetical protein [Natrinema salinisoli]